jgi:hypothetical protein
MENNRSNAMEKSQDQVGSAIAESSPWLPAELGSNGANQR